MNTIGFMAFSRSVLTSVFIFTFLLFGACEDAPTDSGESDTDHGSEEETSTISIHDVDPEEGTPGTSVIITGEGFPTDPDDIVVTIAGTDAEVSDATENELTVIIPDGAESGTVEATVGEEQVAGPEFTVLDEEPDEGSPAVMSIDPEEGPTGTEVVIRGENFGEDPSAVEVRFGSGIVSPTSVSDTELTVEVPMNANSASVEVIVSGNSATGPEFTVTEPVAESYTVTGRVFDSVADSGIEGVEIKFSGGTEPVQTDSDGKWSADGLQGPVTVSVHSNQWDFPIHTRLVLGKSSQVDFEAHTSYDPPSGTRVAYQFREGCSGGLSCDKPFDIWTMDSNGLNKEQLTDSDGSDHSPTWSPDGDRIAFDSDRGGDRTIWIMDTDGSNLTDTGVEGVSPAWSPGGDQIAYTDGGALYVMELDGGESELFQASGQFVYAPTWSPDGSHLAFALNEGNSQTHIWVIEADGDHPVRLTDGDGAHSSPAWHPAGKEILYSRGSPASSARLQLMDPDGSNSRTQSWPNHSQTEPVWSPGGNEILYVYRNMIPIGNRIYWIPADGDAWMRTAPDNDAETEYWANSPAWAPQ